MCVHTYRPRVGLADDAPASLKDQQPLPSLPPSLGFSFSAPPQEPGWVRVRGSGVRTDRAVMESPVGCVSDSCSPRAGTARAGDHVVWLDTLGDRQVRQVTASLPFFREGATRALRSSGSGKQLAALWK